MLPRGCVAGFVWVKTALRPFVVKTPDGSSFRTRADQRRGPLRPLPETPAPAAVPLLPHEQPFFFALPARRSSRAFASHGRVAPVVRSLLQPAFRVCRPAVPRPIPEPGDGGGGILIKLRPLHRTQSGGGGSGERAIALLVVQLPGVYLGRARFLTADEQLVWRVRSEASLAAPALEGIHPGRGSEGGNYSGARLGNRLGELSSADAAAAGAPGSPAPRSAAGSADAKG